MEEDFYKGRLVDDYDLDVFIPPEDARTIVNRVIYEELCLGKVVEESRNHFQQIIHDLNRRGVEGVILGCTEISLLINQDDSPPPSL